MTTDGTIYQFLPGGNEHHVLPMIRSFHQNAEEMGIGREEQKFVVCGTRPESESLYRDLGPAPENLRLRRDLTLDADVLDGLRPRDVLILHSAFYRGMWDALRLRPQLWDRTAVVFWGAELIPAFRRLRYAALSRRLPLSAARWLSVQIRSRPERHARRCVLPRLGAVCTLTPGEGEALQERYGNMGNLRTIVYQTHPREIPLLLRTEGDGRIRVIVGNSAHESGRQPEALSLLARFRGEPMRVICPLAYPAVSHYKDRLVQQGGKIFGPRFEPLTEWIPLEEYHRLFDEADVFIVNAQRQQGLYGVYYSLLRGEKVFLSVQSPTFRMLKDLGIRVFDVRDIASMSFAGFRALSDEDRRRNREIAERHFSLTAALVLWKALLARLRSPSEPT